MDFLRKIAGLQHIIHHAGLPLASSLCSVQGNMQVQSSLVRVVTVDKEVGHENLDAGYTERLALIVKK